MVSQAVLDDGVMEHFQPGGRLQLQYGTVPLAPFMFQDDLLNGTDNLPHAREVNTKVNCLMKERGLNLNKDKSVCMAIGSKKQKSEISKALKENPLMK